MSHCDYPSNTYPQPPLPPVVVGTTTDQINALPQVLVDATTVDAAAVTIDTGRIPAPPGHALQANLRFSVTDRTNHVASGKSGSVVLENYGGLTVAGQQYNAAVGDAALANAAVSVGISGGGTATVTFTPPGGYVGTLKWVLNISGLIN